MSIKNKDLIILIKLFVIPGIFCFIGAIVNMLTIRLI